MNPWEEEFLAYFLWTLNAKFPQVQMLQYFAAFLGTGDNPVLFLSLKVLTVLDTGHVLSKEKHHECLHVPVLSATCSIPGRQMGHWNAAGLDAPHTKQMQAECHREIRNTLYVI